jgi:hypothetical protein
MLVLSLERNWLAGTSELDRLTLHFNNNVRTCAETVTETGVKVKLLQFASSSYFVVLLLYMHHSSNVRFENHETRIQHLKNLGTVIFSNWKEIKYIKVKHLQTDPLNLKQMVFQMNRISPLRISLFYRKSVNESSKNASHAPRLPKAYKDLGNKVLSPEMSVNFYQTARCNTAKDNCLQKLDWSHPQQFINCTHIINTQFVLLKSVWTVWFACSRMLLCEALYWGSSTWGRTRDAKVV